MTHKKEKIYIRKTEKHNAYYGRVAKPVIWLMGVPAQI